jgi:hypothetical protein
MTQTRFNRKNLIYKTLIDSHQFSLANKLYQIRVYFSNLFTRAVFQSDKLITIFSSVRACESIESI